MKFSRQLVLSSLAVFVLSACSSSPAERRQARDDFSYIKTKEFEPWKVPEGADIRFYPNYNIPAGEFKGSIGKGVDIRPPRQVLELISGSRNELKDGEVTMWLLKSEDMDEVWKTVLEAMQEQDVALRENSSSRIETDWVGWEHADEDAVLKARYILERFKANRRYGLKIRMVEWQQDGKAYAPDDFNRDRYTVAMTNMVMMKYDQKQREEAERKALLLVKQIPVSMGKDRNGLPVIIARAQYNIFWKRIADILPKLGFKLEDRNQSQGVIKTEYDAPDEEFWQGLGVPPLSLTGKGYTFQLGDMGNRTSIAINGYQDKAVDEEGLREISQALAAIMKQD